jgi:hypothetical protein
MVRSTGVMIVAVYVSVVNSSSFIAVEVSTVIIIRIGNRFVNASNVTIARVFSASIVIITDHRGIGTSYFFITIEFITFVRIIATIRVISVNTSFAFIATSVSTLVWGNAFVGVISVNTSLYRAA